MNTRGLQLVLTILWVQLLTLPEKLNPAALIVPGAPARSNVSIMVKFFCVGLLLLLGITSSGTVLFAVSMDAECPVELVSGLFCCVAGIVLVVFLLKKRAGTIRPLWLPAAAGAITGGLAVSATYPLSEPELYCWLGGVYCVFFALIIYAGVAGMAVLIRGRRQLMDQYSLAQVPGNQSDKRHR